MNRRELFATLSLPFLAAITKPTAASVPQKIGTAIETLWRCGAISPNEIRELFCIHKLSLEHKNVIHIDEIVWDKPRVQS